MKDEWFLILNMKNDPCEVMGPLEGGGGGDQGIVENLKMQGCR